MALPEVNVEVVNVSIGPQPRPIPRTTTESFDVSAFSIPKMSISIIPMGRTGHHGVVHLLSIVLTVPDRDDPDRLIDVTFSHAGMAEELTDPFVVRRLIHEAVQHEVDEMLRVNGERLFDPHEGVAEQYLKVPYER